MKLKCRPEDFRVEELTTARADGPGRYTFYRLTKRDLGTIEAVEEICRRWNLSGRRVSYAGLKDRHATTIQYLTIVDGPSRTLATPRFELKPVGCLDRPYTSRQLRGNRFELVLRGLTDLEITGALQELEAIPSDCLPNYFDDQRFGSVGCTGEFIAHAWLLGEHERALKLALAEPNRFDRSAVKKQKAILRDHWGQWPEAKARLPRSSARSVVTYLVDHPLDYRGAFARIRRELRALYFSAFQSYLWNQILARWLEASVPTNQLVPVALKLGTVPFPRGIEVEQSRALSQTLLPFPCSRTALPDGRLGEIIQDLLAEFRLTWSGLRIKHLKDVFFSKGTRPCVFFPEDLQVVRLEDGLHPGRRGLRLAFELAKGSYATILVKRLTDAADAPP
jgi:tRNA pseudouridine13 synthase